MRSFLLLVVFSSFTTMLTAQSSNLDQAIRAVSATMHTYSLRLRPGEDLKQSLETVVRQHSISAGALLTCVGSLTNVRLRLANQEGATEWQGHFEIVSLTGILSTHGSHLHVSVSDSTGRTIGGHLLDGCKIYTTAELVLGIMPDLKYVREPDPTFGYKELVIKKRRKK